MQTIKRHADSVKKMQMLKKRRGMVGIRELMTTLVVAGILAIVGVLIFSQVSSSIDQSDFTTAQNTTVTNIEDTVLDSFELGIIALIVLAAVVILGTLFMLGR